MFPAASITDADSVCVPLVNPEVGTGTSTASLAGHGWE